MRSKFSRRSFLEKNLKAAVTFFTCNNILIDFTGKITRIVKEIYAGAGNPVWEVIKELYVPSPEPRVGVSVSICYPGSGLKLEEKRYIIRTSDWVEKPRKRTSDDSGLHWSDWEIIDEKEKIQGECRMEGGTSQDGTGPYDPESHRRIKPVFQRIVRGDPKVAMSEIWKGNRLFCDHGFYQLSDDDGISWGEALMLKYEAGPDFDPSDWDEEKYYRTNEMYIGNAVVLKNGGVVISATIPVPFMDEEDRDMPSIFPNNYREGCVAGGMCFIGRWNGSTGMYIWKTSEPVFLPRRISTRGLDELHLNELSDGRLLLIIRGSNTGLDPVKCPGRKWFSISDDGGLTWSEIEDIKFDNGEQFYSPASISCTIRSSVNGKLYWIGNISENPVEGNSPRYPLVIVEVDEEKICFKRKTLTIIDDRNPEKDSESLQLSNFSVIENRQTMDLEIYLTRLGEEGGGPDIWTAGAYKYTLRLVGESGFCRHSIPV